MAVIVVAIFAQSEQELVRQAKHASPLQPPPQLRYDDLYNPIYDLEIKEALNRLPREIVDARNQRLKRSMGLSMKHEYLAEDLQAVQTPFRSYRQDMLALVKKERAEREELGALPLHQRTIP